MVYLVETTFSAGVYLSKVAIKYNPYLKNARISEFDDYSMAVKKLLDNAEIEIKCNGVAISKEKITPNILYKVKSDRLYAVVSNFCGVGFVKENELQNFLRRYELNNTYTKYNFTYLSAQKYVLAMNPDIPSGRIFDSGVPIEGRWYRRNWWWRLNG